MALTVPLQATPSQTLTIVLNNQLTRINVSQKPTGLYMDVLVNESPIISGVICQNLNRIVRSLYLGFIGDFCFVDNEGEADPEYTGLGSRFSLIYLEPSEL